jgi:hypothetical protein
MALQNGSNTAGFIRLLHVLIADDVMWSLLTKDDIPELASGEARASLGHSLSDLWTHVHEAFIDNSQAVPAIATQHRIFIDLVSNEQYNISRCTLPMLTSDCLYQWYYSTHILLQKCLRNHVKSGSHEFYTAAGLEEFMDDFAHNNTDVCCLVAFAHWQGEDHMPFLY